MDSVKVRELKEEIKALKGTLKACAAILEHGTPVTTGFIEDLKKAAQ